MQLKKSPIVIIKSFICLVLIFLITSNLFYFHRDCQRRQTYRMISERVEKILEIRGFLDKITKELWGIISDYDPEKAKKVKFEEGRQYRLLRQIRENIRVVHETATDQEVQLELDLLNRTVKSLAKYIDALKAQLALQEFDTESTRIFFQNSVKGSTLKDSYIDEMTSLMEKIKTINQIINKNVDRYLEKELIAMRKIDGEKTFLEKKTK